MSPAKKASIEIVDLISNWDYNGSYANGGCHVLRFPHPPSGIEENGSLSWCLSSSLAWSIIHIIPTPLHAIASRGCHPAFPETEKWPHRYLDWKTGHINTIFVLLGHVDVIEVGPGQTTAQEDSA